MPYERKGNRGKLTLARLRTALGRVSGKGRKVAKKTYGSVKSLVTTRRAPFSKLIGNSLYVDHPARNRGAFPNTVFTQHRYAQTLLLNADNTTGRTGSELAFRLAGMYDPYYSGGGHQPLGFDQMTPLYHNYTVYKVDIQVRVVEVSTSGGKTFVAINQRPSTSLYNLAGVKSAEEIQEQPMNTIMDGQVGTTWNHSVYIADIEGKNRSVIFNENNYTGSSGADPVITPYLSLAVGTYDEPGMESSWVRVMLSLVYHARWSNPNPLNQS